MSSNRFLPRNEPTDTDAFFEFQGLSSQERDQYFGCLAVLQEEGTEARRAERDAIAAILQHRRLHAPREPKYLDWLQRGAPFEEDTGPEKPPKSTRRAK